MIDYVIRNFDKLFISESDDKDDPESRVQNSNQMGEDGWSWRNSRMSSLAGGFGKNVVESWQRLEAYCQTSFQLEERGTTLDVEIYAGFVQFVSCVYILPVVSRQLESAGYGRANEVIATSTVCALGCILASYTANLPFIIAPPTSVSIFLSVSIQRSMLTRQQSNTVVILSGIFLLLVGIFRSASRLLTKLIPDCIQASTAVGIGLITALAGAIEIGLVVHGNYTLLAMGEVTPALLISGVALVVIGVAQNYHLKGAFVMGLLVGSVLFWIFVDGEEGQWPSSFSSLPTYDIVIPSLAYMTLDCALLVINLSFLYILTLNGLARSLSDLAELTTIHGSIPRGNWLYIFCGIATVISGLLSGPPVLISPESAAGIKAGAKTGLSTLVAGCLFLLSIFFGPFFSQIPTSGTSPLLLLVGMVLFQNVSRINWSQSREGISAFFVLLLIPFTYSIMCGIGFGYVVYISIGVATGDAWRDFKGLVESYRGEEVPAPYTGTHTESDDTGTVDDSAVRGMGGRGSIGSIGSGGTYFTYDSINDTDSTYTGTPDTGVHRALGRRASYSMGERTSMQSRRRAGSMVDRIPMDLDHSIRPMIS